MSRSVVLSLMIVTGFVGGTLLLGDRLPLRPAPLSAAEEQPVPPSTEAPPALPAEQPDVTERGIPMPGPMMSPKPGMATPGAQPHIQKVPILPKLEASPPPPAQPPAPPRSPAVAAKRSPSLSETVNVLGSLPGGAEAIANAAQRGAKIKIQAGSGQAQGGSGTSQILGTVPLGALYQAMQGPWSITLSPQRPLIGSWDNLTGGLEIRGLALSPYPSPYVGSSHYYLSAHMHHTFGPRYGNHRPPVVFFNVRVPRDGWYMVNCEVGTPLGVAQAEFQKGYTPAGVGNAGTAYSHIYTFAIPYDEREYRRSLPQLLELAAGMHHFSLEVEEGSLEFFEVSITELER